MDLKKFICIIFFSFLSIHAFADEAPTIHLIKGNNEIAFSIVNKWNTDINEIMIIFEQENLPRWLCIQKKDQKINVNNGESVTEKLILTFDVDNPPLNAFTEIPFTLKDNKGNQWNFIVNVKVNSSKGSTPIAIDVLYKNFPNPFNPVTTLKYSIKENKYTKLEIYNSLGQTVRKLVHEVQPAGVYTVQWDGCDENGFEVSSGIYFYRLEAGSFVKVRSMMLLQ